MWETSPPWRSRLRPVLISPTSSRPSPVDFARLAAAQLSVQTQTATWAAPLVFIREHASGSASSPPTPTPGSDPGRRPQRVRRSNIDQLAQIHAFVRAMPPPVVDGSQADFVAPAGRGRSARSSPHGSRNGATARKTVIIYMLAMRSRIDRKFAK